MNMYKWMDWIFILYIQKATIKIYFIHNKIFNLKFCPVWVNDFRLKEAGGWDNKILLKDLLFVTRSQFVCE